MPQTKKPHVTTAKHTSTLKTKSEKHFWKISLIVYFVAFLTQYIAWNIKMPAFEECADYSSYYLHDHFLNKVLPVALIGVVLCIGLCIWSKKQRRVGASVLAVVVTSLLLISLAIGSYAGSFCFTF